MTPSITLRRPDDLHLHLRDGAMLEVTVAATAKQFARATIMPNLTPPITTVAAAVAYRDRIMAVCQTLGFADQFTPLMTAYLTDDSDPAEMTRGFTQGVWVAAKLYPAHATTNSAQGVSDWRKISKVLDAMAEAEMPLLIHGEVTHSHVDIFDREAVFLTEVLTPLRRQHPRLKIVLEHITTRQAVDYLLADDSGLLAATITAHHLSFNRNAIFKGGIRPHFYCLPIAKREHHRLALRQAAISGRPQFFLGTDSAPHLRQAKESACGCAGLYTAPVAMETYAQVFAEEGALDRLEGFASVFGANFYGLPLNSGTITLKQESNQAAPEFIAAAGGEILPYRGGESLAWRLVKFLL
ncbi:MAG: dihydroorotase [Candidatus Pacebacteria bacterium]|nr:dihydroorotase [Candidatus Paceibacterota bacterium]